MKPVAILGAGPAGLMAAHAAALAGRPIALFTKGDGTGAPVRSRLGGAQFLHEPIPYANDPEPDGLITYRLRGSVETYRHKVYGSDPNIPFVSMEDLVDGDTQAAWSLERTYDRLWEMLSADKANVIDLSPAWIDEAMQKEWFDLIVNTVPMTQLCLSNQGLITKEVPHVFVSQRIRIHNECVLEDLPDNTVVYDGDLSHSWYRCSRIFGVGSTEWSTLGPVPPYSDLVTARKPIKTTCTCYEDSVIRLGRHGTWTKGVLTHHAFNRMRQILEGK